MTAGGPELGPQKSGRVPLWWHCKLTVQLINLIVMLEIVEGAHTIPTTRCETAAAGPSLLDCCKMIDASKARPSAASRRLQAPPVTAPRAAYSRPHPCHGTVPGGPAAGGHQPRRRPRNGRLRPRLTGVVPAPRHAWPVCPDGDRGLWAAGCAQDGGVCPPAPRQIKPPASVRRAAPTSSSLARLTGSRLISWSRTIWRCPSRRTCSALHVVHREGSSATFLACR